jgi:hypothetical protein
MASKGKAVKAMEFDDARFRMDRAKQTLIEASEIKSDKPFMRKLNKHNQKMAKVLDKAMGK